MGNRHHSEPAPPSQAKRISVQISASTFAKLHTAPLVSAYQITSTLRYGTSATIYLATHLPTGLQRSVKTISKDSLTPEQLQLLKTEALHVANLDHPNILKIFDVYEEETQLHIVSEHCSGGELLDRVFRRRKISEQIAASYMQQIVAAVACCHENGLVLRDIRPDHVLFEAEADNSSLRLQALRLPKVSKNSYSIAPELTQGADPSDKSDIFCLGVIMYILVCILHIGGTPPTLDTSRDFQRYSSRPEFVKTSSECQDLLRKMINQVPESRPSAVDVLNHPWIQHRTQVREDTQLAASVLTNMKNFRASVKLEHAALRFIATQLATSQETEHLRRVFRKLDLDGDGRLSREELQQGYKTLGLASPKEVDAIMAKVDSDHNGYIDYVEFITSAMNWKKQLCASQLDAAFQAFDADGSGAITVQELKAMFGGSEDAEDSVWLEMMAEVDQNHDGMVRNRQIDVEEFKQMIMRKINTCVS